MDTKECLLEAIHILIQKYSVRQITIKMILDTSGVSKSTFYRYYHDKYELINDFYQYYHQRNVVSVDKDWKCILIETTEFLYKNKDYFRRIAEFQGQNCFLEFLEGYYLKLITDRYKAKTGKRELDLKESAMLTYEAAGAVGLFKYWMLNDSITYREIDGIHKSLTPEHLKRLL